MYFDTHAHYDSSAFDNDRAAVLSARGEDGVDLIIDPGCDVESSEFAVTLSREYPFVYAAVGIHPEELGKCGEGSIPHIRTLAGEPKTVAIGEIGLD